MGGLLACFAGSLSFQFVSFQFSGARGEIVLLIPVPGVGLYTDLKVYQRACELAGGLHRCVATWSKEDFWTVGVQLVRSVDSIGANIAEGYGRGTVADRRRFVVIARGSAFETEHWLLLCHQRQLLVPAWAKEEAGEISQMLNGLARGLSTSLKTDN